MTFSLRDPRRLTSLLLLLPVISGCAGGAGSRDAVAEPGATEEASSDESVPADVDPIVVGAAVDQTSYLAERDGAIVRGAQLGIEAMNASGGAGGQPLELRVEDMAADPQRAVQAVQKLITQDDATAVLAGFSSAGTAAAAPLATQNQTPVITASVLPEHGDWIFSTLVPVKFDTGTRVQYLQEQGVESVGILLDPTPYNQLLLDSAEAQLAEAGIDLVGAEQHAPDAVDLRPQLSSLLQESPDAIMKLSSGPTDIVVAKAMAQTGATIPLVLGANTLANVAQASDAYDDVTFVASRAQVYEDLDDDEHTDQLDSFIAQADPERDPTYEALGWDTIHMLAAAIASAGGTDGEQVRAALEDLDGYEGASGSYDFSAESHFGVSANPYYLAEMDGERAVIVFRPAAS